MSLFNIRFNIRFSLFIFITFLTGCIHTYQDLKAPCSYHHRYGCGATVPMQQNNS